MADLARLPKKFAASSFSSKPNLLKFGCAMLPALKALAVRVRNLDPFVCGPSLRLCGRQQGAANKSHAARIKDICVKWVLNSCATSPNSVFVIQFWVSLSFIEV